MLLFETPPATRYDLRFKIAGIPIRVHPLFWVIAILFGASTNDFIRLLIWIPIVFASILIHELGHALAMRLYGRPSQVVLYVAGGLTLPEPVKWGSHWANVSLQPSQEILVSLAGPFAGFLLAALIMIGVVAAGGSIAFAALFGILPVPTVLLPIGGRFMNLVVTDLLWVNFFWGLLNLMPVYPLDGGNIMRHLLLKINPLDGARKSLLVSVIAGGVIAAVSLIFFRSIYITILFGLLAFQSYLVLKGRARIGF